MSAVILNPVSDRLHVPCLRPTKKVINLEAIVHERCGDDAELLLLGDSASIIQPATYGQAPVLLKTELEYIGEGKCEEYDEADPRDAQLLRFTVWMRAMDEPQYEQVENGSYCTLLPSDLPIEDQIIALTAIHREAEAHLEDGFKRAMEFMSWISPGVVNKLKG